MTTTIAMTSHSAAVAFQGDLAGDVAELAVESDSQDRSVERQIAQTEEDIASSEASREVADLRKKADDLRTEGLVDGCATMGAGALDAASAGCSFAASGASSTSAARLQAEGAWYKSGATGLEGSGKLADGLFGAAQANEDADAKQADQDMDRANQAARSAHDAESAEQSGLQKILDSYAQVEQTQASASLSILRRA